MTPLPDATGEIAVPVFPERMPAPSRVGRLAPNLIAALIGFCVGVSVEDPSFEAFNRDQKRR